MLLRCIGTFSACGILTAAMAPSECISKAVYLWQYKVPMNSHRDHTACMQFRGTFKHFMIHSSKSIIVHIQTITLKRFKQCGYFIAMYDAV